MNDYLHLFTPRCAAHPYMDFAAGLRAEEPTDVSQVRTKFRPTNPRLFSFYHQDMQKWKERIEANQAKEGEIVKKPQSPLKVRDFETRGNPGTVPR